MQQSCFGFTVCHRTFGEPSHFVFVLLSRQSSRGWVSVEHYDGGRLKVKADVGEIFVATSTHIPTIEFDRDCSDEQVLAKRVKMRVAPNLFQSPHFLGGSGKSGINVNVIVTEVVWYSLSKVIGFLGKGLAWVHRHVVNLGTEVSGPCCFCY